MTTIRLVPMSSEIGRFIANFQMANPQTHIMCFVNGIKCELMEFNEIGIYLQSAGSEDCDIAIPYGREEYQIQFLVATKSKELASHKYQLLVDTLIIDFNQFLLASERIGKEEDLVFHFETGLAELIP